MLMSVANVPGNRWPSVKCCPKPFGACEWQTTKHDINYIMKKIFKESELERSRSVILRTTEKCVGRLHGMTIAYGTWRAYYDLCNRR